MQDVKHVTKIKEILNPRYEIALVELSSGEYQIAYADLESAHLSERLRDLSTALFLFDIKQQELAAL